jgi:sugar phosphate isomerase/epimerase
MDRRHFLAQSGAMAALFAAPPAFAAARPKLIGIQLWTVAKLLAQDFEKTIAMLAGLGYRELEMYGPYDFSDDRNKASWAAVTPSLGFSGSGFFGRTAAQVNTIMKRHGLKVPSLHTDIFTLQTGMGKLAEAAHALGATYVTLPSLPAEMRKNLDDYKRAADLFNKIGQDAMRHGVRFGYHNHGYGLSPIDGKIPLRTLLDATDPKTVFLELDVYWNFAGGGDPKEYLSRYKGRYKMVHLKDMKGVHHFDGDGGNSSQWIELFQYLTYLGDGNLDMKGIIKAAEASGVEHYFVEQDRADDLMVAIKGSADFLKKNGFR